MTRILRLVPWQAPAVITSVADVARGEANGLQVVGTTRRPLRGARRAEDPSYSVVHNWED
jgi:hypothetical protein